MWEECRSELRGVATTTSVSNTYTNLHIYGYLKCILPECYIAAFQFWGISSLYCWITQVLIQDNVCRMTSTKQPWPYGTFKWVFHHFFLMFKHWLKRDCCIFWKLKVLLFLNLNFAHVWPVSIKFILRTSVCFLCIYRVALWPTSHPPGIRANLLPFCCNHVPAVYKEVLV